MKKYLLWLLVGIGWGSGEGIAQVVKPLFLPLGWEEASSEAARSNKLVLLEVVPEGGKADRQAEKKILASPEVRNFLQRNAVLIRMDENTPEGRAFKPRLWIDLGAAYVFFMPYGELLTTVAVSTAAQNPDALLSAGKKAREMAAIKKQNSRSVVFQEGTLENNLKRASEEEKLVFAEAYMDHCPPCLQMEKNVFTLDRVADFYNQHFINIRLNLNADTVLKSRYNVKGFPAYLFLNSAGKVVHQAEGYCEADTLITYGRQALEKARGVVFHPESLTGARLAAAQQDKGVLLYFYNPADAVHKEISRSVFVDPDIRDLLNGRFICVAFPMQANGKFTEEYRVAETPLLVYWDTAGNEVHRRVGYLSVEETLQEIHQVLEGKGLAAYRAAYQQGERESRFVEEYVRLLGNAGEPEEASEVAVAYLSALSPEILSEEKYWDFFVRYVQDAGSGLFEFLLQHREELSAKYGKKAVEDKIRALWIAGAEQYLQEGKLDENGLKAYGRRLKKEKVEGWRSIVRNVQMKAAEERRDWKTYVELAEEKWYEGEVSDAELYAWGVKINQQCHNKDIRFKAARWFALAASEIERKERQSGKINLASYKGFFEKLVDDLVGKE